MGDCDNGSRHVAQSVECSAGAVFPGVADRLPAIPVGKVLPVPLSDEVPLFGHTLFLFSGGTCDNGYLHTDSSPDSGGDYAGEGVVSGLPVTVDSNE